MKSTVVSISSIVNSDAYRRLKRLIPLSLRQRMSERALFERYYAAMAGRAANEETIYRRLVATLKPVTCPLILISQVERSGGTLMAHLFDGHPEILAHSDELKFGYPTKHCWPVIVPSAPVDEQFRLLFELDTITMCEEGYVKGRHTDRGNFFLIPRVQRDLFRHIVAGIDRSSPRQVLDAYFTSYFNAWLNLRSRIAQARFITGFAPMMIGREENMDQFWSAYPDGYLISSVRSPLSWHVSMARLKGQNKNFDSVEKTADRWLTSTRAILRERRRQPDRTVVVHFDDLVTDTESVMRRICERVGIGFHPALTAPTFNGDPVGANTTFGTIGRGQVSSEPTARDAHLSKEDRDYLEANCMPLYEEALREIATSS